MEAIIIIKLTEREFRQRIPFGPLAESVNKLQTGKAKRLMNELGISKEMLSKYQEIATRWYLHTGCPDSAEFTLEEISDWNKLGLLLEKLWER